MLLLEELMQALRIEARPFALCRVGEGACMPLPPQDEALIHYVVSGSGALRSHREPTIALRPGTLVILPAHTAHEIVASDTGSPMPVDLKQSGPQRRSAVRMLEAGWQGRGIVLACGRVCATYQSVHGLFDYLPTPIVERAMPGDAISNAFSTLVQELSDPQPGTLEMTGALLRECLVVVLRRHSGRSGVCRVPWLCVLEQPQFSSALTVMLQYPERHCTLAQLAELAGMSRSSFSSKFARTFGRTVMAFIKEARVRRAAELLRTTQRPIKSIAADVGYQSRSHFSRTFKRIYGLHPADFRRRHAGAPAAALAVSAGSAMAGLRPAARRPHSSVL